jgi:hypothetical protein
MELQYLGRKLLKAEDVNHIGSKLDWSRKNLQVLDHSVHGFWSNRAKWFVTNVVEPARRREWNDYFSNGVVEVVDEGLGWGEDIGGVGDGEGDVTFP